MTPRGRAGLGIAIALALIAAAGWIAATPRGGVALFEPGPEREEPLHEDDREVSGNERRAMLQRAQVWRRPEVGVREASLSGSANLESMNCKFKVTSLGGTTPKFDCETEDGEEVRIKYGKGPEIPAEAAATRLLSALGFGADDVTLIQHLRCYGCPNEPFSTIKAVNLTRTDPLFEGVVNYAKFEDFGWVARERKFDARPIEGDDDLEGWSFFELDLIDARKGGAPRAHVDGLRMMAVFLAHWDNKSENQRMVCLTREWPEDAPCPEPFLMMQDVGATFGPLKVDFDAWQRTPIWDDRAACTISMRTLPYKGATFGVAPITEEGRQFVGGLLSQLTGEQITALFTGARFHQNRGVFTAARPVSDWVRAFAAKVASITSGPPCPQ